MSMTYSKVIPKRIHEAMLETVCDAVLKTAIDGYEASSKRIYPQSNYRIAPADSKNAVVLRSAAATSCAVMAARRT